MESLSYALTDNGNMLYAVKGYGGIWSRLLNQLNVSINEEPLLQSSFYIFPNPAHDILNIQSVNNKRSANLQIFDINGNMKLSKEMLQEQTIVNTGTLNPGVYIIRIEYDQKVVNYKLLIY
ncbi:MAG: T9SS type A sorting domain-containing protein [Bacteroidales bacterium]|nr:T9SS type A sorting domain-containing protein [Bacteroidales bacterium]